LKQVFWAAWNAGERGLAPAGIWNPPPLEPGSGKFGTPWDRMQSANLIPADWPLEFDALPGLDDEPHAASAIAQPMPQSATAMLRTLRVLGGCLPLITCDSSCFEGVCSQSCITAA
jgi:hypothetical protein